MTALMLLTLVFFQTISFLLSMTLTALCIYATHNYRTAYNPHMLLRLYAVLALSLIAFGTLVSAGNGLDI